MSFIFSEEDFDKYVNDRKPKIIKSRIHDGQSVTFSLETTPRTVVLEHYSNTKIALDENIKFSPIVSEQYVLQKKIRSSFGKTKELNKTNIAGHPDFEKLVLGQTKEHFITTMFVDIKGSTELSLKYPDDLEFIYNFKNGVIKSCIDVIRGFDGFVHRIMGDAVLGFFGSSTVGKSQSILDCLNAATLLAVVLENTIQPWLVSQNKQFDEKDFGFRIGCNFGDNNEILWGNYGYGYVGEISPTGLPVDLAAKLQSEADKNQIMLGQGLLEFFNFPEILSGKKKVNGYEVDFLKQDEYEKKDGQKLNYIMRLLKRDEYILGLPIGRKSKLRYTKFQNGKKLIVDSDYFILKILISEPGSNVFENYYSNSKVIPKGSKVKVEVVATGKTILKNYTVNFYKTNNSGFKNEIDLENALDPEHEDYELEIDYDSDYTVSYGFTSRPAIFQRDCSYKGLHTIRCDVVDKKSKETLFRDYIYVPIE